MRAYILALTAGTVLAGHAAVAATCESLTALKLPNTTITVAKSEAAGTFAPRIYVQGKPTTAQPIPIAFCRVAGSIKPTADSDIKFEVWLPPSGWTGRYQSIGNAGAAGYIHFENMITPLLSGSAVAGTDNGHDVTPDAPAAAQWGWGLGHPEKVVDYYSRAVHLTAENGKAITRAFYGEAPKHSYFVGCSKGGHEAMMEAQRYPNDFDGIVAGAPANQIVKMNVGWGAMLKAIVASEPGYLSPADVQKIGAAVTAACGDQDGLLSDPRLCRIDFASLPLSPAKIEVYKTLHDGPKTKSGQLVAPGLPFGTETVGWVGSVTGPGFAEVPTRASGSTLGRGLIGNFVYGNSAWDFRSFDPDKSPADIEKALGSIADATDTEFAGFKARGGKLISYHGWSDALITPLLTIDYYNPVVAAQGRAGGPGKSALERTQDFYRLFMAPGMGHCGGGPGPNRLGQNGGDGDAEHDVVTALQRWVEKGEAPTRITATKFVDNDASKSIEMTRPLCLFPKVAKYNGTGDSKDAANFTCRDPG